jgi:hypothetical protein
MTCIEDLTQRLADVGLTPLPTHYESLLHAICGGTNPEVIAKLILRLHEWPKLVLALSRRFELSDEDYERLRDLFLSNGKNLIFQAGVSELTVRNANAPEIEGDQFDLNVGREKVIKAQRTTEFAMFLEKQGVRIGELSLPDQHEISALRTQFISGSLTTQALHNVWAKTSFKRRG